MKTCPHATPEECSGYIEHYFSDDEYMLARIGARFGGWDSEQYKILLDQYVCSTQVTLADSGKSATDEKGDPFEDVVRYFLEKGGVARYISPLTKEGKWQIDGEGLLNRENLMRVWGERDVNQVGSSLLLECKNYSKSVGSGEFCKYNSRMDKFGCQLGILASSAGFSIHNGKGIAEDVYVDSRTKKYHLLLTVEDFCIAYSDDIPPLQILTEALHNAKFDKYQSDKNVQEKMSAKHCNAIAEVYYTKISDEI